MIVAGLGRAALLAALGLAGVAMWVSLTGRAGSGRRALGAVAALVGLATACLAWALVAGDYSLVYVADATSQAMSWPYRLGALWGGMEGSLLLWVFLLSGHGVWAAVVARRRSPALAAGAQAVLAGLAAGFLLIVLTVADPFARLAVPAVDGGGLTPVLEHRAMLYHPPLLYLGQTALAVPFALTMAALASGRLDGVWLAAARRSALLAWVLLSTGMLAGAHWAYVELGWGGFWAWDPVENGSLMPWLVTTAFLHAGLAAGRRAEGPGVRAAVLGPSSGPFWSAGLALAAFGLVLLGVFLTRSGVTDSVHSFAEARAVGVALLGLLALSVTGSAGLLAARRARWWAGTGPGRVGLWSKEWALRVNNALLIGTVIAVAAGTLVPVVSRFLAGSRIVVSPGFFAAFTAPVALAVLALLGIGPLLPWHRRTPPGPRGVGRERAGGRLRPAAAVGAGAGLVAVVALGFGSPLVVAGFAAGGASLGLLVGGHPRAAGVVGGHPRAPGLAGSAGRVDRRRLGGKLTHAGLVLLLLGVLGSTQGTEAAAVLQVGDRLQAGDYVLVHRGVEEHDTARRQEVRALVDVLQGGRPVARLRPGLDAYQGSAAPLPESALRSTAREDLLIAVRRIERSRGEITVEVFVRPLVAWVWWGGLLMIAGGAWALSGYSGGSSRPRRFRSRSRPRVAGGVGPAGTGWGSGSGGTGGAAA